ncbi:MAG: ABC transporter permease [Tissierellaceae bacterium]
MIKYILRRLMFLIPVVIAVTFVVFFIVSLSPGNIAAMIIGDGATKESIEQLTEEMGLNDPIIVQYGRYISKLVTGDMGKSYATGKSVSAEIASRFPNTLKLTILSIIISVGISIPIGVISATKQYSILDYVGMVLALIGISMPSFWFGLMLIIRFALKWRFFPSGGAEGWTSIILPAITLGVASTASITRVARSSMLEVLPQDYIRTAKAKGVNKKDVIMTHALRNALIPTITIIGLEFGELLGGAILTETVFSWPGIGRLMVESINRKDVPMVLGTIIVFAVGFSIVNLIVDILYAYIDPRIKANYR